MLNVRLAGCIWIATVAFMSLTVSVSSAQVSANALGQVRSNISAGNYYYVSKPGELTMEVNIWGSVRSPGRYEIPTSTNLVQLLSFAGGPVQDAILDRVRVTRFTKDSQDQVVATVFEVNLEDLSKTLQTNLTLFPGDTIYVDYSSWSTYRDIFTVVTALALVTAAVAEIIYFSSH